MSDQGKVGTAPGRALRVLIVEDEVNDFELVMRELRRAGYDPAAQRVETESQLRDCLLVDGWEIAIVDHNLPHFSSGPALRILREHDPDLPVIVVSGVINEQMAVDLMRAGAADYVSKDNLARLTPAIERELNEAEVRRQRHAAESALGESEQRYRGLFDNSLAGFALHDIVLDDQGKPVDYIFLEVNDAFEHSTGLTREAVIGRRVTEVIDDVAASGLIETYGYVALSRRAVRFNTLVPTLGRHFDIAAFSPRTGQFATFFSDVSEQRVAEQALRLSRHELAVHDRIKQIFLTSPDEDMYGDLVEVIREEMRSVFGAFVYLDDHGGVICPSLTRDVWDECRMTGKSIRLEFDPQGPKIAERALAQLRTLIENETKSVPRGHMPIERVMCAPLVFKGVGIGYLEVANKATDYTSEDGAFLESIAANVAPVLHARLQRARAEETLLQSEQRHRALFEQSPVGVFIYDEDLVIVEANEQAAHIVGVTREQLIGFGLRTAVDTAMNEALEAALGGGASVYEGPYHTTIAGLDTWGRVHASPLRDAGGVVTGGIAVVADLTEQKRFEERIAYVALHDAVTGLPNRTLFSDRLRQALAQAGRGRQTVAVMALDLDRFRSVNDSLGRVAGDQLLRGVAGRLADAVRPGDTIAHSGEDKFLVLLTGIAHKEDAALVADKLMEVFVAPWAVAGSQCFLGVSAGISVFPGDGKDEEDLLRNAETAMRAAKALGGDGYQFCDAVLREQASKRFSTMAELHTAIEEHQFALHYQPLVRIADGALVGAEALVRWMHPTRGMVPPLDFIPLAEESGLIVQIGEMVLRTACADLKRWHMQDHELLRMSVNVSARQFQHGGLVDLVDEVLRETGVPPACLEIEITETLAIQDAERAVEILENLRALGVRVALDDYGTGYSSLSHLSRLPITTVKIDRMFISDMLTVAHHGAITTSVIELSHKLGLTVVAEGIETLEQLTYLADHDCDLAQGFLLSRPVPAAAFEDLLSCRNLLPGAGHD